MSKPLSFKESLVVWRTMAENLAAHLEEMPHLRETQEALLALVERSAALVTRSSLYEAKLREVNRGKVVAFAEGRELRNRLAHGLQGTLGAHSERLIEFGVPPRPRDARRKRLTNAERAQRAAEAAAVDAEAAPDEPGRASDRPVVN